GWPRDWSSDVCSSDLRAAAGGGDQRVPAHGGGLAHDRAPCLAGAGADAERAARSAAQAPALIGHLQTIAAALWRPPQVALARERWDTPDGDFIDVDFAGEAQAARLMVLLHGLEGCSDSHYGRLLARALPAAGWRVAMPHWRGCSG